MVGRHRRPSRWRHHANVAAPAAVAAASAGVAFAASAVPSAVPVPAVVSDVEATTGSLPIVTPEPYVEPDTVRFSVPASVAAQALTAARETPEPAPTTAETTAEAPTPVRSAPTSGTLQQRIAQAAHTYVGRGIPYRYGGKTCTATAGCDCSALVWRVLQQVGMDAPYRNSAALKRWATPVTRANAVPGDLVLFPGHVGIYAGDGMLIDHGGPGRGANLRKIWGHPSYGRIPAHA